MIRQTLKAAQHATYSVDLPDPHKRGMPTPKGTGFFVSPDGWFVTAAHVITENGRSDGPTRKDLGSAWLTQKLQRMGPTSMCQAVSLDYIDPKTDFALLKVDFSANATKHHLVGPTRCNF